MDCGRLVCGLSRDGTCLVAGGSHRFALETSQIAVSCAGIVLIVTWYGFYGELSWTRLLTFAFIVTVTSWIGGWLSDQSTETCAKMVLIVLLAAWVGLAFFYLARRLLGWRIFHVQRMGIMDRRGQFSIADSMVWMLYFSLLTLFADRVRTELFQDDVVRFVFFFLLGILFPVVMAFFCLWLVGNFRPSRLLIIVPLISLGIAAVLSSSFHFLGSVPTDDAVNWFFWPNFIWFSVVGLAITFAGTRLRKQGFVFAFSKSPRMSTLEDLHEFQQQDLHARIASATLWQERLQQIYRWCHRQLEEQKQQLERDLATLDETRVEQKDQMK